MNTPKDPAILKDKQEGIVSGSGRSKCKGFWGIYYTLQYQERLTLNPKPSLSTLTPTLGFGLRTQEFLELLRLRGPD